MGGRIEEVAAFHKEVFLLLAMAFGMPENPVPSAGLKKNDQTPEFPNDVS